MDGDQNSATATQDPSTPAPTPSAAASGANGGDGTPPEISNAPLNARAGNPPASPVSVVPANQVRPAKRGGLAGVLDDLADSIAGTHGSKTYTDAEGNEYIDHPALSRKGQWLKIASEAVRGAAAGASAKPGPGQLGRAAEAGVEAGDKTADMQRQRQQEQSQEVRQANQDRFNAIKLKHDMAAKEFELTRLKVKGTQDDVKFAQEQIDRERKLGSADLGVYKDEADLARVKEQNPNFWKDVYKNNIVAVNELGDDGERQGIHLFLRTPGIGSQLVEPGTPIKIFVPGKTPKDPPTLDEQIPTVPMTHDMRDSYNDSALNKMRQWQIDNSELGLKASETERNKQEGIKARAESKEVPSKIDLNKAEANKANADADKAREKESGAAGYLERQDGTVWIGTKGEADQGGLAFEPMKPGDIIKDKQAMRQLNDVQLNTSRYTRAAQVYSDPQTGLTYHGKPVSEQNPVHPEGPLSLVGLGGSITDSNALRQRDNTNLNTLMNKAGYADMKASLSAGGHIEVPVLSAFTESLSRQISSKAYNELSDQAKDLYDGYLRTLSAVPAYIKVLTTIGRSNKEILNLELANIKHPGYAPSDILRGQEAFQQNIDKAADGFPRNMVGVPHPSDTRRQIENNGGNPDLPDDVKRLMQRQPPPGNQ
jgi:hypothetical protein